MRLSQNLDLCHLALKGLIEPPLGVDAQQRASREIQGSTTSKEAIWLKHYSVGWVCFWLCYRWLQRDYHIWWCPDSHMGVSQARNVGVRPKMNV